MRELVFVYGTLKSGQSNHSYLYSSRFIGNDSITAKNISRGPVPGIIEGEGTVEGEVYECDPISIYWMDDIEGTNYGLYNRRQVTTHKGKTVWVYFAGKIISGLLQQ